jgi:hypothetical protein
MLETVETITTRRCGRTCDYIHVERSPCLPAPDQIHRWKFALSSKALKHDRILRSVVATPTILIGHVNRVYLKASRVSAMGAISPSLRRSIQHEGISRVSAVAEGTPASPLGNIPPQTRHWLTHRHLAQGVKDEVIGAPVAEGWEPSRCLMAPSPLAYANKLHYRCFSASSVIDRTL